MCTYGSEITDTAAAHIFQSNAAGLYPSIKRKKSSAIKKWQARFHVADMIMAWWGAWVSWHIGAVLKIVTYMSLHITYMSLHITSDLICHPLILITLFLCLTQDRNISCIPPSAWNVAFKRKKESPAVNLRHERRDSYSGELQNMQNECGQAQLTSFCNFPILPV